MFYLFKKKRVSFNVGEHLIDFKPVIAAITGLSLTGDDSGVLLGKELAHYEFLIQKRLSCTAKNKTKKTHHFSGVVIRDDL